MVAEGSVMKGRSEARLLFHSWRFLPSFQLFGVCKELLLYISFFPFRVNWNHRYYALFERKGLFLTFLCSGDEVETIQALSSEKTRTPKGKKEDTLPHGDRLKIWEANTTISPPRKNSSLN